MTQAASIGVVTVFVFIIVPMKEARRNAKCDASETVSIDNGIVIVS